MKNKSPMEIIIYIAIVLLMIEGVVETIMKYKALYNLGGW